MSVHNPVHSVRQPLHTCEVYNACLLISRINSLMLFIDGKCAPCGLRVVRMDPLHFLGGCRTRRLNQVKVHTFDIVPLRGESPPQKRSGMARVLKGFHSFTFIRNRNEPYRYLPLPSQLQLVLIYRPRRDGKLSRPWCEVAQAEIRTRNLPIANLALYHTATSAP